MLACKKISVFCRKKIANVLLKLSDFILLARSEKYVFGKKRIICN
jgi:hypothetical protein